MPRLQREKADAAIPRVDAALVPRRVVHPFAFAGHLPFVLWLVPRWRPRRIVELGVHTGNSLFAFAQAAAELRADGHPCELFGVESAVDLRMGTFSKSFASCGGFIAGPTEVIEYLRFAARAFLFSAAGVPAAVGTWVAANLEGPMAFLIGVNVFLFLVGMFIESGAAIVVVAIAATAMGWSMEGAPCLRVWPAWASRAMAWATSTRGRLMRHRRGP